MRPDDRYGSWSCENAFASRRASTACQLTSGVRPHTLPRSELRAGMGRGRVRDCTSMVARRQRTMQPYLRLGDKAKSRRAIVAERVRAKVRLQPKSDDLHRAPWRRLQQFL